MCCCAVLVLDSRCHCAASLRAVAHIDFILSIFQAEEKRVAEEKEKEKEKEKE